MTPVEFTSSCEEMEELLPGYVLGVLSASETAKVARHLRHCRQHATSIDAYEAVCDVLCAAAPSADPPAHLKARLLASLTRPRSSPHRANRSARLGWAVAALVAALAVVFGVWAVSLQSEIAGQAAERQKFRAFASQPETRMVPLEAGPAGGSAKGVLFLAESQAAVWAIGLPKLEGDQVYQCWWIDATNRRVSGGSFKPEGGAGTWFIPIPEEIQDLRAIVITLEPNGESVEPQGPNVLSGEF